jgi:hypothetical protein
MLLLILCLLAAPSREELVVLGRRPEPPAMPRRAIAPPATQPAGEMIDLLDGDVKFKLFVPPNYHVPADGKINLTVHFHTVYWFILDEHLRRDLNEPLAMFALGEGSSTYRKPFQDTDRFDRILRLIESTLRERMGPANAQVGRIDITSFSAGYGAVREIVKQDRYIERIRRIILSDSLYAGWDPAATQPGATSRPAAENIDPWKKFVALAACGEKTFVLTHSMVPTPYANSAACAKALIEIVAAPIVEVKPNESAAARNQDYPIAYRADLGRFHVWGYHGDDAQAHMTHVRHMADVWKALDACGDR